MRLKSDVGSAIAPWSALVGAIGASQVGQALLKAGATGLPETGNAVGDLVAQVLRWPTAVGLGFYSGGVLLYMVALRRIPMSVALPCTTASFVAASVVGAVAFGEPVGARQLAGLALICAGVVLLATTVPQTGDGSPAAGGEAFPPADPRHAAHAGVSRTLSEWRNRRPNAAP